MKKLFSGFKLFNCKRNKELQISVSVLSAINKEKAIFELNNTDVDYIHLDVMDGKFVDNSVFSFSEINKISNLSLKKIDIHYMVDDPMLYIDKLEANNVRYITFHLEIDQDVDSIIYEIKKRGFLVGIAISPDISIDKIFPYLNKVDLVLVMSVIPGKGGQKFINGSLDKIYLLKKKIRELGSNVVIEVDGGIKDYNIHSVKDAGADIVVVGSYVVNSDNYIDSISRLRKNAK